MIGIDGLLIHVCTKNPGNPPLLGFFNVKDFVENHGKIVCFSESLRVAEGYPQKAKYLAKNKNWLPFLNAYRTMCLAPEPDFRRLLEATQSLAVAA